MNLPLSFQIDLTMADGVMRAIIKEGGQEASVISERMDDNMPHEQVVSLTADFFHDVTYLIAQKVLPKPSILLHT